MKLNNGIKAPNSALPLYSQVEAIIRNKIMSGQLMPGDLLPKEQDLAEQFNVSQITIRTALSRLKEDGLIVRSRAKGTFVADVLPEPQPYFIHTSDVYSLVGDASRYEVAQSGFEETTFRQARYPKDLVEFFGGSVDQPITICRRLRSLGGEPIMLLENHISPDYARNLTEEDLRTRSVLKALKEKAGLSVGRGEFFVEAIPAEPDIAGILEIDLFQPVISVKVYFWFENGEPFEVVNSFTRADRSTFKGDISLSHFEDI